MSKRKNWFAALLAGGLMVACSSLAFAGDQLSEWSKSNNWTFEVTRAPQSAVAQLYITLRLEGNHWVIDGIANRQPNIQRSEPLELFAATPDLQKWRNVYTNRVINCDSFEAKEADYHSVCTSTLSEKLSERAAMVGLLFGGTGSRPIVYNEQRVTAAIQSIPVEQAQQMLDEYEKRLRNQQALINLSR